MPVFKTLSVEYNGLDFPAGGEEISLDNGEAITLSMENFDIELGWTEDNSTVRQGDENKNLTIS